MLTKSCLTVFIGFISKLSIVYYWHMSQTQRYDNNYSRLTLKEIQQ